MKISVIIPAAGSGTRFGGDKNKIFEKLGNGPVFLRTLEAFTSRDDVIETILVCSQADMPEMREKFGPNLSFMGVKLVAGGETRTDSVRNALAEVSGNAELVAVHDAARPCIAQPWLDAVFAEAAKTGAALLAVPIHGTIKRADENGAVSATLKRDDYKNLWEAQTPQVFRREIIIEAYETGGQATDDCALVESIGHKVSVVPGDLRNIKITRREDLEFARAVINTLPKPKESRPLHPFWND